MFADELDEQISALQEHFDKTEKSGTYADLYCKLADDCGQLANAAKAGDFREAKYVIARIYRLSTDSLSLEDEWLAPVHRIQKLLHVLVLNVRCPYCDGYLRSAKAKQCPECLRAWRGT